MEYDFRNLFTLEMANNHQGSLKHGKKIVDEMASVASKLKVKVAIKLQYRDLWPDLNFIHKDYRDRDDVKHVPRFKSTRLTDSEFIELIEHIKSKGLISMVTPFDEASVDKCLNHEVEIIKVASCSVNDWPLLEKIASVNKPTIISTGGSSFDDIDNVYTYFRKRVDSFAIMHCVGVYPCPNELMNLDLIKRIKKRYPDVTIGYSGHEDPDNIEVVMVAAAKGAEIFEGHVGVETNEIKLNKYSKNPEQVENWISSVKRSIAISGSLNHKEVSDSEAKSLLTLKRGVFASRAIGEGEKINTRNVYFAMPCVDEKHLDSSIFGKRRNSFISSKKYKRNEPIYENPVESNPDYARIRQVINKTKSLLNEYDVVYDRSNSTAEVSHHKGLKDFYKIGMIIINEINREYCKKLLVLFPNQLHPEHYHKKKEEIFQLLSGELYVKLNSGDKIKMRVGDKLLIKKGVMHEFWCENEHAVIEEISTTYFRNDSYYSDKSIRDLDPMERKTIIEDW